LEVGTPTRGCRREMEARPINALLKGLREQLQS
jgi:hypothetical protein